jgi:hypothetical protein
MLALKLYISTLIGQDENEKCLINTRNRRRHLTDCPEQARKLIVRQNFTNEV